MLARAREKGLDPVDLKQMAEEAAVPELVAAARFMQQYHVILDDLSAVDYPELVYRAVQLAERPDVQQQLRARFGYIAVDEYQDTDPSQVRLLQALAGGGRDLVVVGDPDQSIYGFRGAEVRGILDFPDRFRRPDGRPADVVALRSTRRFGPRLLAASRAVAAALPTTGAIGSTTFQAFREPAPTAGLPDGELEVCTFDTERAETEHVADRLRRAHLEDGIAWSDMAVLVRSGRRAIPGLRRALGAAGVPVEVAGDDTPMVEEPAVLPLLDALRAVVNLDNDDTTNVDYIDPARVESLLVSPIGGMDATEVRALCRDLLAREKQEAQSAGRSPAPSPLLLRDALLGPEMLDPVRGTPADKAGRLGRLLLRARTELDEGATAEEVLWLLWSGTEWPQRLRRSAEVGGPGARLAHRDLDAVCALFEVAARAEEQRGHTSVASFVASLRAQQIPADTLAERGVRGEAVRLLTAHRSKGLEWRFVVVMHVQEQLWPDLRRRATLLFADRIGPDGLLPPPGAHTLLAEERRLFYVACTRARERLLVTAVRSVEEEGEQPSRFLEELGPVAEQRHLQGRPTRPLSLDGLVAELRRTVADPAEPAALRNAAARRLARLALEDGPGGPLVPHADPGRWWGLRARSVADRPLRHAADPLALSASALEGLLACPVKWFLEREAGGVVPASASQAFGQLVHALADRVAKGDFADAEDPLAEMMAHVDRVWDQIPFRTPWSRAKERAAIEEALRRFLDWQGRPGARTVVATEQHLSAEVTLPDGERVRLNGYADRLELDEDGRMVVVDLKTSKQPPLDKELSANPQLGLYQHAVNHGAADALVGRTVETGGAELVQLRKEKNGAVKVQTQAPQPVGEEGALEVERQLMRAAAVVRGETFVATPGRHCDHCGFQPICPVKGAGTVLS